MSRKHYERIAEVFAGDYASCNTTDERRKVVGLALSLSDVFQQDNPAFDRIRFLKACGLTRNDAPCSFALHGKDGEA